MEQELTQTGIAEGEGSQAVSKEGTPVSKLYTEEDLKAARLGQSKADAALNEALRTLEQQKADYTDLVAEREELRKEIERRDDEAFAGDTEGRSAARLKRDAVKAQRELSKREKELERGQAEIAMVAKATAIKEIGAQYGINPDLLRYANTRQEAEELAVAIKAERSKTQPSSGFRPDSGVSDVGGRGFTREEVAAMSYDTYKANKKDIDAAYRAGRIK